MGSECFTDTTRRHVVAGQKLGSFGVIVDTLPLHNPKKLKELGKDWYAGNQLAQPLGGWIHSAHVTPTDKKSRVTIPDEGD